MACDPPGEPRPAALGDESAHLFDTLFHVRGPQLQPLRHRHLRRGPEEEAVALLEDAFEARRSRRMCRRLLGKLADFWRDHAIEFTKRGLLAKLPLCAPGQNAPIQAARWNPGRGVRRSSGQRVMPPTDGQNHR
jgi:hypothetical protein